MLSEYLNEHADRQFPANRLDYDDYLIGEDFAISPETLRSLSGKNTTKTLNPIIQWFENDPLILDEHELALS